MVRLRAECRRGELRKARTCLSGRRYRGDLFACVDRYVRRLERDGFKLNHNRALERDEFRFVHILSLPSSVSTVRV